MKKTILSFMLSAITLISFQFATAQAVVISGKVTDGEIPLAGVNIIVKDKVTGTISDLNGNFKLSVPSENTVLVFSMVGYKTQEYQVQSARSEIVIVMEESVIVGDEVVISASRVEENIMESPVTIEKMDIRDIRETPAVSFYDALANIKGVDVSTQSLTFQSVNTRGFGSNGNERFVQLIDGIDNQAPGLNFPVGNIVGISELDLESVELIPGASSALYGPNAINGILLMNSKSPFEYQGLSMDYKLGVNHVDNRDDEFGFFNKVAVRYAKAYNDKFAFKVNMSILEANDFIAVDERDQSDNRVETDTDTRETSRTYDGVNVYGEQLVNLRNDVFPSLPAAIQQNFGSNIPPGEASNFTLTGYSEKDFVDNDANSFKFNTALHFKINDEIEWINQFNYGTGNSIYTGNDRYVFDGFYIWTAKTELKGSNFFLRAYTTQENSGDSYAANGLATRMTLAHGQFVPTYTNAYLGARGLGGTGADSETAHQVARAAANQVLLQPGTPEFNSLYDSLRGVTIAEGGARFLDKTSLYQVEGMYNLSSKFDDAVEVIVGGNYRLYNLNSEGTLFALDDDGNEYNITEWGGYAQFKKKLFNDGVTLSGSVRYDKNQYFEGQFSPRLSAVVKLAKNQYLRLSGQRGFRMPTTQDQFINLDIGVRRLVGSNDDLVRRYRFNENTLYTTQSIQDARTIINEGGTSADARQALEVYEVQPFDTEKITTFEVGYKGTIANKLFIDGYVYYSTYQDFIIAVDATQAIPDSVTRPGPENPQSDEAKDAIIEQTIRTQRYGIDINSEDDVTVRGAAIGIDYSLPKGYILGINASYNELVNEDELVEKGLQRNFNTPKYKGGIKFSNREVFKNTGFSLNYRWQDAFIWQSAFGTGVIPAFGTLDFQVSRKIKKIKSIVKLGGSNILNNRYTTSFGNPSIGGMYYIGISFDEFLN